MATTGKGVLLTARSQAPAQPNPETLLSFLSKRGGINLDEQLTTLGDTGKQANKGYREGNLFRKGGDGMDSIAIAMHEAGYLTDAEFSDVDGGVQAARAAPAPAFLSCAVLPVHPLPLTPNSRPLKRTFVYSAD